MKKLKKVYVEITNVCNLACAFCPGTSRKPGFMPVSDFLTVLRKLKGHTDYLYLHVLGEPLLHPELDQLLELCAAFGYKVNITTNGTKIADRADILLSCAPLRQINFSLHCREENDYATIDKYLDDIFDFTCKALDRGRIYVSYRLWNITSAASERYNGYIVGRLQERFTPGFSLSEAVKASTRITIRDRLFLNCAGVFHWPVESAEERPEKLAESAADEPPRSPESDPTGERSGFCLGLRDQAAILVDGTVVPCCLDSEGSIKIGNIFEDEFEYILNGERARKLYEGFSKRQAVESLCMRCGYRSRFS
ncbi:MAG TPA: SPASM domain-containing protein [Clostridia bacterium]|nr:SPASM domain-containing protein [Clostridia bacterium]